MANDYESGVVVPLELTEDLAVSAHAALRRYVTTSRQHVALVILGPRQIVTSKGKALPVFGAQCGQSASFAERYGPITDLAASRMLLPEQPAVRNIAAAPSSTIIDDGELVLETRRGLVTVKTESFTNGRLNFVLIFRRG